MYESNGILSDMKLTGESKHFYRFQPCNFHYFLMSSWPYILLLICLQNLKYAECSFDPFMDNDLFKINWEGPLNIDDQEVR